jgi:hypothetical protein
MNTFMRSSLLVWLGKRRLRIANGERIALPLRRVSHDYDDANTVGPVLTGVVKDPR